MIAYLRRAITALVLLACLVCGHALAQTPQSGKLPKLPIKEQQQILMDAMQEVLQRNISRASDVRVLGIGSWMDPMAGTVNDIDATLGHPNREVEAKLVEDVNSAIEERMAKLRIEKLPVVYAPHDVKLIKDSDLRFKELFRGETGQLYARQYADKRAMDGMATMRWEVAPNGAVTKGNNLPTDFYWRDTGKKLPEQITHPEKFFDDLYVFARNVDGDPLKRSLSYAKHLDNIESFLLPAMKVTYNNGDPLDALKIEQGLLDQMEILKKLKASGLEDDALREAAAKALGVRLSEVDGVVTAFMANVEKYLEKGHHTAGIISAMKREQERLKAIGKVISTIEELPPNVLNRILNIGTSVCGKLQEALGPGALDALGRFADIGFFAQELVTKNGEVSAEDTAKFLLGLGFPEAWLAATLGDLAGRLGLATFTASVNAFVLNPLILHNSELLQRILNPADDLWLYGGKPLGGMPNPLVAVVGANGWTLGPETIYCASLTPGANPTEETRDGFRKRIEGYADGKGEHQNGVVDEFVKALREAERNGPRAITSAGAAAFSPQPLVDRLATDWSTSQGRFARVQQMELEEKFGERRPPALPLLVEVDGTRVHPELRKLFPKKTKPGQPIEFMLTLQRQFGFERYLEDKVNLAVKWCELGGMEQLKDWLSKNQFDTRVYKDSHETGKRQPGLPDNIQVTVDVTNVTGWSLDGQWPLNLGNRFGSRFKATESIFITLDDAAQARTTSLTREHGLSLSREYLLSLTPDAAAGPVRIDVTLQFTDTFGIKPPKQPGTTTFQMTLTGSVEAPALTEVAAPPNPAATTAASCEAIYQAAVEQFRVRTQWNIAGYSSVSNSCPAAETVLDACYKAANVRRDSGIHNADTDACTGSFTEACRAENLVAVAVQRDQCLALANTQIEEQKARDQAAVALQKAREGQRARELAKQAQAQAEQLARQQEADRLRKIEEEKRAAERRAREQAQQAESQQASRWEELQRQGAAQAALDRQREIDAQRRKAEEADARRRADAERRQREEQDRAEIDTRNRPPASVPAPAPPAPPAPPTPPTPPVPSPQIPTPVFRPPAGGWPSDFSLEVTAEPRGSSGYGRVRKDVLEVQQNKLIRYNGLTTAEGTFNDGLLQGRWPAEGVTFEFHLNADGTVAWTVNWVEPNGQPSRGTRDGTWTMKPLGGSASPSASPPQVPSPPDQTPPSPSTPPAQTPPPVRTPPPTAPPGQQQPPCPPAPLPGLENLQTNLRCFGIPGPGQ